MDEAPRPQAERPLRRSLTSQTSIELAAANEDALRQHAHLSLEAETQRKVQQEVVLEEWQRRTAAEEKAFRTWSDKVTKETQLQAEEARSLHSEQEREKLGIHEAKRGKLYEEQKLMREMKILEEQEKKLQQEGHKQTEKERVKEESESRSSAELRKRLEIEQAKLESEARLAAIRQQRNEEEEAKNLAETRQRIQDQAKVAEAKVLVERAELEKAEFELRRRVEEQAKHEKDLVEFRQELRKKQDECVEKEAQKRERWLEEKTRDDEVVNKVVQERRQVQELKRKVRPSVHSFSPLHHPPPPPHTHTHPTPPLSLPPPASSQLVSLKTIHLTVEPLSSVAVVEVPKIQANLYSRSVRQPVIKVPNLLFTLHPTSIKWTVVKVPKLPHFISNLCQAATSCQSPKSTPLGLYPTAIKRPVFKVPNRHLNLCRSSMKRPVIKNTHTSLSKSMSNLNYLQYFTLVRNLTQYPTSIKRPIPHANLYSRSTKWPAMKVPKYTLRSISKLHRASYQIPHLYLPLLDIRQNIERPFIKDQHPHLCKPTNNKPTNRPAKS